MGRLIGTSVGMPDDDALMAELDEDWEGEATLKALDALPAAPSTSLPTVPAPTVTLSTVTVAAAGAGGPGRQRVAVPG